MASPCVSACSPWPSILQVQGCSSCSTISDDDAETYAAVASDLLFELSGRRFPGSCLDTVRPCARSDSQPVISASYWWGTWNWNSAWGSCSCNRPRACGCSRLSEITLGGYPVTSIVEVTLADDTNPDWLSGTGTATLDPSLYRVDDYRYLVRLPNPDDSRPGWPCCQDLALDTTQEGTFSVTYTYGVVPPPLGQLAAAEMACQLSLACSGSSDCRLPSRVTEITRQGVTMVLSDPAMFLEHGLTGLTLVDQFLRTYNKNQISARAQSIPPGATRRVRRTDTGVSSGS